MLLDFNNSELTVSPKSSAPTSNTCGSNIVITARKKFCRETLCCIDYLLNPDIKKGKINTQRGLSQAINTYLMSYISHPEESVMIQQIIIFWDGQFQRIWSFSILRVKFLWVECVDFFFFLFASLLSLWVIFCLFFNLLSFLPSFLFHSWKLISFDVTKSKFVNKAIKLPKKKGNYPCLSPLCI